MEIKAGMVVLSAAGHSRGEYFFVKETSGSDVFLVNGKTRKQLNPKRKNKKHVELPVNKYEIVESISEVSDKKIRRLLQEIRKRETGSSAQKGIEGGNFSCQKRM